MKKIKGLELLQLNNQVDNTRKFQQVKDKSIEPYAKDKFKEALASKKLEKRNQSKVEAQASEMESPEKEQQGILEETKEEKVSATYDDLLSILSYLMEFEDTSAAKDFLASTDNGLEKITFKDLMEYLNKSEATSTKAEPNTVLQALGEDLQGESFIESLMVKLQSTDEEEAKSILNSIGEILKDNKPLKKDGSKINAILPYKELDNSISTDEGDEAPAFIEITREVKIAPGSEQTTERESNSNLDNSKDLDLLEKIIASEDKEPKNAAFNNVINRLQLSTPSTENTAIDEVSSKTTAVDVVKVVKYMEKEGLRELTVRVNPKELGTITIKLIQEGNVLKAALRAANEDTYSLLNNNLNDIKALLSESNIKVQEVAINIYNEDTTYFAQGFNDQGLSNGSGHKWSSEAEKGSTLRANELEEDELSLEEELLSAVNTLV